MEKGGSKQMIIIVDTETGKIVSVADEKGNEATKVDLDEFEKIYQSPNGFKHISTMLFAHSSPGCIYISIGGRYFKICR
jgi:hypothetical protein